MRTIAKNLYVSIVLFAATAVLVVLEALVLSAPPSGAWFAGMLAVALFGFGWANTRAFVSLKHRRSRTPAVVAVALGMWAVASFVAVMLGVNLKLALGGQL
jgi:membrane associated rhomboid family serine protease